MTQDRRVHRAFAKTAPDAFWDEGPVKALQGVSRDTYILEHGFSAHQINIRWWAKHEVEIVFPTDGEVALLTRADLFEMGRQAPKSEHDLRRFVWHVIAWGGGMSVRNNLRRLESIPKNTELLGKALQAAAGGNPREAYSQLVQRGGAAISGLGPAFFTKLLYFASEGAAEGGNASRCLILDARVARSLYHSGWSMARGYPTKSFSYNWYTDTYVSYCELLKRWASEAGDGVTPDMIERKLWERSDFGTA